MTTFNCGVDLTEQFCESQSGFDKFNCLSTLRGCETGAAVRNSMNSQISELESKIAGLQSQLSSPPEFDCWGQVEDNVNSAIDSRNFITKDQIDLSDYVKVDDLAKIFNGVNFNSEEGLNRMSELQSCFLASDRASCFARMLNQ